MAASVPKEDNSQVKKSLDLNLDFFKTPHGLLRISEGVIALAAIISISEGTCYGDGGRFGFGLFVTIVSMLEAIFVSLIFVFRLEERIKAVVNLPLTLLLNDGISLIFYFIACTLSLLSIGRCSYALAARVFASLFTVALFLVLVGLVYIDFVTWENSRAKENEKDTGTTITESSPTILT